MRTISISNTEPPIEFLEYTCKEEGSDIGWFELKTAGKWRRDNILISYNVFDEENIGAYTLDVYYNGAILKTLASSENVELNNAGKIFTSDIELRENYTVATITRTYVIADYPAGTMYAEGEEHVLDDLVTVMTTQCYFTTQLRIFAPSYHNGYAIIYANGNKITNFVMNARYYPGSAGKEEAPLNIYASKDGENWTLIEVIQITKTAYVDYALATDISNAGYTYLKLDIDDSFLQGNVRLASFTITMQP